MSWLQGFDGYGAKSDGNKQDFFNEALTRYFCWAHPQDGERYRTRQFWLQSASDEARSVRWFRSWIENYHDTA
ncbi:MAG: hypothetical protein WBE48_02120 [Xanthobacteraceae bacterium]